MRKVASILIKIPVVWQLPFWRWLVAALGLAASLGWTEDARAQAANGLDVQTAGHGEPELVFLSGPDAPGDAWDHVAARFEVACRCHVVASAWTDHAPDALAGEVVAYIRAQGMVRPVLIGRGHGGALALTIAARAPDLPGRLVLVDSLPASCRPTCAGSVARSWCSTHKRRGGRTGRCQG